jgi:hypothetical protein
MFRISLQPTDLEIIPYTAKGSKALRIVHKPTMLQVSDESNGDYYKVRDKLLQALDVKVQECERQRDCGYTTNEMVVLIALGMLVGAACFHFGQFLSQSGL